MSTIREILSKYKTTKTGLEGALEQSRLDYMLEKDFEKIAPSFVSITYLLYNIREVHKSRVCYKTVIEFFDYYNVQTLDDFYNWEDALKKADISKIVSDIQPKYYKLNYNNYETINKNDLKDAIWNLIPDIYRYDWVYNKKFFFDDSKYKIIPLQDLKEFLKVSLLNRLSYLSERRDCDDFAQLLKCEFRKYGYGNVTVAKISINLFKNKRDNYTDPNLSFKDMFGAHAINMAYVKDNNDYKLILIEPQRDTIFNFGDPTITTKYYKIRYINV